MKPAITMLLTWSAALLLSVSLLPVSAGATQYPWLSWRHDINNTGAAAGSGYPATQEIAWQQVRENEAPYQTPARCTTPVLVGGNIVITTGHGGRVEARDQYTGELLWTKLYTWIDLPPNPEDAPQDWCQGSSPSLYTNTGICGYTVDGTCPDWCLTCAAAPNDCSAEAISLISPLHFPSDFGVFCAGATIDLEEGSDTKGRVYFGTMDGRFFCLDLETGEEIWQKQPWKDPGGPNEGRAWYDQKFAWHLSPPSIHQDKMFFGSFLPSFYWVFKAMPFILDSQGKPTPGWPSFDRDFKQYWVGRDGWAYCAEKMTGDILWGWDPGGCGVTNIPPVAGDAVLFNADTVIDYHYGQMAACDISTGEKAWHVGPVPMAQGGNPAVSVSRSAVFWPEGDGAVWATDFSTTTPGPEGPTAHINWTFHGGFQPYGATGVASSVALDEKRGWVIGASDTGHLFVVDMDTGLPVRRTYLGVDDWKPADGQPDSGFYFPGASAPVIVPEQGLLYIAGTDFDSAWQGSANKGKEKLFCYDYTTAGNTLKLVWEYQFRDDEGEEHIVKGHDPYQVAFYSLGTPALADGHVYYGSYNGRVYCFGKPYSDNATACPAELALSGNPETLDVLRAFRDNVLSRTEQGRTYVQLFYRHRRELARLLLDDHALRDQVRHALVRVVSRVQAERGTADGGLLQELMALAAGVAEAVAAQAQPALRQDISRSLQVLRREAGR
ncbi:PQQ-binding-like beta-propeller repeat protein [Thermodesulfobacteriota bacterium]